MSEKAGNKLDPSFWLSLVFVGVIAVWVATAARFDWDTRVFPWAVGIPALALALRQLVVDWRGSGVKAEQGEGARYAGVLDIAVDQSITPEVRTRHTIRAGSWILGFACGIWFFGFLISIPLFVFLYLIYEAHAGKIAAVVSAGLTFLFIWVIFDTMMHIAWPEAALFALFGF
jgi:hypothetical protein